MSVVAEGNAAARDPKPLAAYPSPSASTRSGSPGRSSISQTSQAETSLPQQEEQPDVVRGRSGSVQLNLAMAPGDMLFVRGTGGLAEIGTTGGYFGHVMLILRPPRRIEKGTEDAYRFENVWPKAVQEIWMVRTVEATRHREGLHEADMLVHVSNARRLKLIGEIAEDVGEILMSGEGLELWQTPPELRAQLQRHEEWVITAVLEEMRGQVANWSWATAARAVMRSANHFEASADPDGDLHDSQGFMEHIQEAWESDPICTSVIITFLQSCLFKIGKAEEAHSRASRRLQKGNDSEGNQVTEDESYHELHAGANLIHKWLPLKADRSLPGDLLETMKGKGWIMRKAMERDIIRDQSCRHETKEAKSPTCVRTDAVPESTCEHSKIPPRFCSSHAVSCQRPKVAQGAPMLNVQCLTCETRATTTYKKFSHCGPCSVSEEKCMICGAHAPEDRCMHRGCASAAVAVPPPRMAPLRSVVLAPGPGRLPRTPGSSVEVQAAPLAQRSGSTASFEVPALRPGNSPGSSVEVVTPPPPAAFRWQRMPGVAVPCSEQSAVSKLTVGMVYITPQVQQHAALQGVPATQFSQSEPPPRYCSSHGQSEARRKHPRLFFTKQCSSCGTTRDTNYLEFELCARCSEKQARCMICGNTAPEAGTHVPLNHVSQKVMSRHSQNPSEAGKGGARISMRLAA